MKGFFMKKRFFATLVLFASLALTACGGGNGGESKTSGKSSKHTHSWTEWTEVTAPTCEGKGQEKRTCACGEEQTREKDALGHNWDAGVVTKAATCSEPGEKTFTCSRCHATKKEEIKADHVWDAGTEVAGAATEAAYKIFTCTVCNKAKKIEFAAKQATGKYTIDGSLKDDSTYPDYMKLGSNGNSVTYTFQSTVGGTAKIYQRGVMDYWHDGNNDNHNRNYFSGKNSTDGNFELKVNGTAVDYSWSKDVTYEQMLPGEYTGTYSPLGDALIGECSIQSGANTIVYKRTESYNMLIKDFVIIIDNPSA